MKNILISACLIGEKCRYDGKVIQSIKSQLSPDYNYIPFCPEVAGGLSIPRIPCEIVGNAINVFDGIDHVVGSDNQDYTRFFIKGAKLALRKAIENKVECAILKENSPSCGSTYCYDGSFSNNLITGMGLTSYLLIKNNIRVYSEQTIMDCYKNKLDK